MFIVFLSSLVNSFHHYNLLRKPQTISCFLPTPSCRLSQVIMQTKISNEIDLKYRSWKNTIYGILTSFTLFSGQLDRANAIGTLPEYQQQDMVIQDISFNVQDVEKDINALKELFQQDCRVLRQYQNSDTKYTVMGFGPETYSIPKDFRLGVNTFSEYGGHATITLKSNIANIDDGNEGLKEYFIRGDGVDYIKIGNSLLRLSKGIEAGVDVKYAYGWVDADTPNGIPLRVIVGISRDPIMAVNLKVTDLKQSLEFFTQVLGMKELPFPLARQEGSQFEPQQTTGSAFVGYGSDSFGIILTPPTTTNKKRANTPAIPAISPGSQFNKIGIVFDDSKSDLPDAFKSESLDIKSPDGYSFSLIPYSKFMKVASN